MYIYIYITFIFIFLNMYFVDTDTVIVKSQKYSLKCVCMYWKTSIKSNFSYFFTSF